MFFIIATSQIIHVFSCNETKKCPPSLESASSLIKFLTSHYRSKLVAAHNNHHHIIIRSDLAGGHLDRHANLHGLVAQVGQLGTDH